MHINAETRGPDILLTLEEARIDAASAVLFKDTVRALASESEGRVVLNMANVAFIDSSGLGAIVGAMKLLGAERRLEIASLTPNVEKVFRLTRMDTVFAIHPTAEDAFPGLEHAS
jgi:anti-sigma B factor antagonist